MCPVVSRIPLPGDENSNFIYGGENRNVGLGGIEIYALFPVSPKSVSQL